MKKGFTLLEMMLVLTVIATVFLLTVPNISRVMSIINDRACDSQIRIIDTAILEYQLKNDVLPYSVDDLISEELITEKQGVCRNGAKIYIQNGKAYASSQE